MCWANGFVCDCHLRNCGDKKIMCATCVNAVKTVFPEYANDDKFLNFVLWEKTAFPFADGQHVAHQVLMLRGTVFVDGEGI